LTSPKSVPALDKDNVEGYLSLQKKVHKN